MKLHTSLLYIIHPLKHEMWLYEMWLQLLQAKSQQCAPHYCPGMFEHWVTQPSTLSLTLALFLPPSLPPLSHSHTLSSRPSVLGEHMRRSDPILILLPLLSIIQSALLGKQRNGQKKQRPHKQINNSSLSDKCTIEISPSHIFPLIQFDQTYMWGWALSNHIVCLQIIYGSVLHFYPILYLDKAKTESLIGTAPPLHVPPEIFRV